MEHALQIVLMIGLLKFVMELPDILTGHTRNHRNRYHRPY